jgi:RNA polymerase sigma-70 factor (ECF subfamily)
MAPKPHLGAVLGYRERLAFERVYEEHFRGVLGVASRVLGDATQAQDVVQDVFLGLWRDPGRFDAGRGPIGHYLRMVARSRALDIWREAQVAGRAKTRLRVLARAEDGPLEERPVAAAERHAGEAIVRRELMRLPDEQREAIVHTYWGGLTAEQIAESSGTPVGTVKSRIRMGVIKLRERCECELSDAPDLPLAA